MARQKYFTNEEKGLSGSIRARSTEDIEAVSIVYVSRYNGSQLFVSLADAQYDKRSSGLLFVNDRKRAAGQVSEFYPYIIVPYVADGEAGDTLYLTKNGKWGTKKTKTAKPIGKILPGLNGQLSALIAPQGRY